MKISHWHKYPDPILSTFGSASPKLPKWTKPPLVFIVMNFLISYVTTIYISKVNVVANFFFPYNPIVVTTWRVRV